MLQALRDKTSGWIAIAIVAVLAVPFAFFGMEQYLFQNNADYAVKVEAPPKWWQSAPDWWLVTLRRLSSTRQRAGRRAPEVPPARPDGTAPAPFDPSRPRSRVVLR